MSHPHESYTKDMTPFFEEFPHKTLIGGSIIGVGSKQFRTELWWKGDAHCFVFINISGECSPAFCKSPSYVYQAIKEKKIQILKHIT